MGPLSMFTSVHGLHEDDPEQVSHIFQALLVLGFLCYSDPGFSLQGVTILCFSEHMTFHSTSNWKWIQEQL